MSTFEYEYIELFLYLCISVTSVANLVKLMDGCQEAYCSSWVFGSSGEMNTMMGNNNRSCSKLGYKGECKYVGNGQE
jgi:hypothetical protein